jgi:hypothetical protein
MGRSLVEQTRSGPFLFWKKQVPRVKVKILFLTIEDEYEDDDEQDFHPNASFLSSYSSSSSSSFLKQN